MSIEAQQFLVGLAALAAIPLAGWAGVTDRENKNHWCLVGLAVYMAVLLRAMFKVFAP